MNTISSLNARLARGDTTREAIVAAGLDWEVGLRGLMTSPDGTYEGCEGVSHRATYRKTDGKLLGVPVKGDVKSLVWYSPKTFSENGYEIPTTYQGLLDLTEQMTERNEGPYRPWCVGFGSGDATGWVGTDWVEDLVLRNSGPEAYDAWVAGELKFDSPEINKAMDTLAGWMKNPDYVNAGFGDVKTIAAAIAKSSIARWRGVRSALRWFTAI